MLPHENFGSHLDGQQRTIDKELEKRNFAHAGQVLCDIWYELVMEGHETLVHYINPDDSEIDIPDKVSQEWISQHVQVSQYLLQKIK